MAVEIKKGTGIGKENMCSGCIGLCCRGPTVDLTTYDMFRIVLSEGKVPDDFVTMVFAKPDDAFAFRTDQGMVKMIVRQKPGGHCVFLNPEAALKCTVERVKPAVCLSYPFWYQEGEPYLRNDVLCPPRNKGMADRGKMSKKALSDCHWESSRYMEIVTDWNMLAKENEPVEKFLKFAAKEMELESTPWGSALRSIKRRLMHAAVKKG